MRKELVAALTSHLIRDIAPIPAIVWRSLKKLSEAEIPAYATAHLSEQDASLVAERLDRVEDYAEKLGSLSESGVSFLTEFSPEYPKLWRTKLGDRIPSHLFVAGNVGLLRVASLGVVGSREIDEAGIAFTQSIGQEAARQGLGLISGGARGVDEIAMKATLEAGGSVVGILADSLTKTMKKWDLGSQRVCLASPFTPGVGFQVANAMSRNKLIYAASEATVIVSSALETGGTWAGATEALRQNLCPILVRSTPDMPEGNQALIGKGGRPITDPRDLAALLAAAQPMQGTLL